MSNVRIGIVGGMGPLAGIHLQKLIVEATPATRDQDHLEVLCFTNPHIPDRTTSLEQNDGEEYVRAILASLHALHRGGATHAVIPCNTSHARFDRIRTESPLPVINLIDVALQDAMTRLGPGKRLGLLATRGTLRCAVYPTSPHGRDFAWELPDADEETELMDIIYSIKAGTLTTAASRTLAMITRLHARGADGILLGCTELSLFADELERGTTTILVDPLRSMAAYLVRLSQTTIRLTA